MPIGLFPKPERKIDQELLARIREMPCVVCGIEGPSDPSHIQTRGSGGHDQDFNVFPKCRAHHQEWHQIGWYRFLGKYPDFLDVLLENGWEFDLLNKNMFHRRLR